MTAADARVRGAATYRISYAGAHGQPSPLPGVVARLVRLYRAQSDPGVRLAIRNEMPGQVERQAAVAFLRSLAAEADPSNTGIGPHGYFSHGDPRTEALARLAEMGPEGRAALQAMHRSGEARSRQARIVLDDMARRGFPVINATAPQP